MKVTACLYCDYKILKEVTYRSDGNGILQCGRCGVMMVENISDDTESLYTSDYFEKDKGTKNGYTDYLSSPVGNLIGKYAFARLFTEKIGSHLDLGCADGSLMEIFSSEGFMTKGLEISKDAVKIANTKGLDVRFSRLHSFPENLTKSDVITAYDLLEHADKPGVVLREVYENLVEGGHFVFSTLSVTQKNPTDYWFNNSLEHYVYYDEQSLEFILSEVFGKDNFAFVEMNINGVAEFWGVATKGKATSEIGLIKDIKRATYPKRDAEKAYLLSLFYNQVSHFELSTEIIDKFKKVWTEDRVAIATFFNNFYQGKLERAVDDTRGAHHLISAKSIYWQAYANAERTLFSLREKDLSNQILELRSQVFALRNELHALTHSRILGRIIRLRNAIGNPYTLPLRAAYKARRTVARFIPDFIRLPLMRRLRGVRSTIRQRRDSSVAVDVVENKLWKQDTPLISVVIPYYNRADTIDDTLNSLASQTFRNFETIIVDDNSSEAESIKKLKDLQGVKVIYHKKNQGVAVARNNGIKQARGKYIICLDSDDMLDPTFIEKATLTLESNPDIALVTTHQDMFGVVNELFEKHPYDPLRLIDDNMVITAAQFRREAWEATDGYRTGIGYEDWDFWLTLAEKGFWGRLIPEDLFKYRTSMQSRYVDDKDAHWNNVKNIRNLHPQYKSTVRALMEKRRSKREVASAETAFRNLESSKHYQSPGDDRPNVLVTVPWLDFGGVSTLLYNFMREVQHDVNFHMVTGLKNKNEWDYKFKEVTPYIYHMPNMFEERWEYQLKFLANYIETRHIDVLHIVHNGFIFKMLPTLKSRFPDLKVVVTVFNDRAPYLDQSVEVQEHIDMFTTDNNAVHEIYVEKLTEDKDVRVIPNGINIDNEFNPLKFDRDSVRKELDLQDDDLAVFFIGRLSEEKNPDVFVDAASLVAKSNPSAKKIKFVMVGDGNMSRSIAEYIGKKRVPRVRMVGYQSDVARYLSAADVFVLPSAVEGFPLSILEAMAMEVAVVASRVGAIPDIIREGENGYIVDPGSAEGIVHAVDALLDSNARRTIQRQGRKDVEKMYSSNKLGQGYRKLYKEVL